MNLKNNNLYIKIDYYSFYIGFIMNINFEHVSKVFGALDEKIIIVNESCGFISSFSEDLVAEELHRTLNSIELVRNKVAEAISKSEIVSGVTVESVSSFYKLTIIPLNCEDVKCAAVVVYDITETALLESSFKECAVEDPLTGIYNRRFLFKELNIFYQRFIRGSNSFSTIMINIDNFDKLLEDHGAEIVDKIFSQLVVVVKSGLRGTDLFAKVGNEDFILLLPDTPSKGAVRMCERLKEFIEDTDFDIGDKKIKLTASFGCSEVSESDGSYDNVVNRSEIALYQAKHAGIGNIKRLNYESWKK